MASDEHPPIDRPTAGNDRVKLCEMALRDGMQVVNRGQVITLDERLRLAEAVERAGLPYAEMGSFVSHKAQPAMRDTPELLRGLGPGGAQRAVLVPTWRQYQRAHEVGCFDTVAVLASASEAYSQLNTRMSIEQALDACARVTEAARADGYRVRSYLSYAFRATKDEGGGEQPVEGTVRICRRLVEMGCETIALSDTDGRATPPDIERLAAALEADLGLEAIGVHLHDRYGFGLTNAHIAYRSGIRTFDTSLAGVGGNPALPYAVGNIATEELVWLFHSLGIETGIDEPALLAAARLVPPMLERAGLPPTTSKVLLNSLAQIAG